MYELRAVLESHAARRAATRVTAAQLDVLRASCDRFAALVGGDDLPALVARERLSSTTRSSPAAEQRAPERHGAPGRSRCRSSTSRTSGTRPSSRRTSAPLPPAARERARARATASGPSSVMREHVFEARDVLVAARGGRAPRSGRAARGRSGRVTADSAPDGGPLAGLRVIELGHAPRRAVHRAAARRPRSGDHQGRGAGEARPDSRLGQGALRGAVALVARAVAEQEVHHAQPARAARARSCSCGSSSTPTSSPRTSGPGRSSAGSSATTASARSTPASILARVSGYGQTGPYAERAGFASVVGGDGRDPPHQRLPRRAAAAHAPLARRLARRHVRRPGDPRRDLLARRGAAAGSARSSTSR